MVTKLPLCGLLNKSLIMSNVFITGDFLKLNYQMEYYKMKYLQNEKWQACS